MKKVKNDTPDDDMRPEYDFSHGVRGKYFRRYHESSNVVVLEPDVSEAFPNAATVNEALRVLVRVARSRVAAVPRRSSQPTRGRTKDSHRKKQRTTQAHRSRAADLPR